MIRVRPIPAAFALLALLAVAGCAERQPPPSPPPPMTPTAPEGAMSPAVPNIDWHARLDGDRIRVELVDPEAAYLVERVALVGPGGRRIGAQEVTRASGPGGLGPSYGVGGGFGSHSGGGIGFGMSVPLGGYDRSGPARRTFATIVLPDEAAYRRTARDWTVEVQLRDRGGAQYHASIPAPLP